MRALRPELAGMEGLDLRDRIALELRRARDDAAIGMVRAIDGAAQRDIGQRARLRKRDRELAAEIGLHPGKLARRQRRPDRHVAHQRDRGRRMFGKHVHTDRGRLHAGADGKLPAHPGRGGGEIGGGPACGAFLHQRPGDLGEPHGIAFIDRAGAHAQRHDRLGRDAIGDQRDLQPVGQRIGLGRRQPERLGIGDRGRRREIVLRQRRCGGQHGHECEERALHHLPPLGWAPGSMT